MKKIIYNVSIVTFTLLSLASCKKWLTIHLKVSSIAKLLFKRSIKPRWLY